MKLLRLESAIKALFPNIQGPSILHKGQFGRVGIVGGSEEYTGAPYFAAMGAYNIGVDLVHVFCHPKAAPVIRSFSPDLIVYEVFQQSPWKEAEKDNFVRLLNRCDCVVLGPGAGLSPMMQEVIATTITTTYNKIPLICDADVFRIPKAIQSLVGHNQCLITPNMYELKLLEDALVVNTSSPRNPVETPPIYIGGWKLPNSSSVSVNEEDLEVIQRVIRLIDHLKIPAIAVKGMHDIICSNNACVLVNETGSVRRAGGQGDLLSGAIGGIFAAMVARKSHGEKGVPFFDVDLEISKGFDLDTKQKIKSIALPGSVALAAFVKLTALRIAKAKGRFYRTSHMLTWHADLIREMATHSEKD